MRRSQWPLVLALVAFSLTLISGAYAYNRLLRTVPVLVASQEIAAGTELTPELVHVIRVPAGGTPPGALYGPGQVAGRFAAVPVFSGETLTSGHISSRPPARDPLSMLAPEQRIISVPVRPEAVLGGALLAGDTVDVAAAFPPPAEGKAAPVEVLAKAVKVVDLRNAAALSALGSQQTGSSRQEDTVPTSVLLQVDSTQARGIVGAVESKATIYLWLAGRDRQ